jgi:hypothetical protein
MHIKSNQKYQVRWLFFAIHSKFKSLWSTSYQLFHHSHHLRTFKKWTWMNTYRSRSTNRGVSETNCHIGNCEAHVEIHLRMIRSYSEMGRLPNPDRTDTGIELFEMHVSYLHGGKSVSQACWWNESSKDLTIWKALGITTSRIKWSVNQPIDFKTCLANLLWIIHEKHGWICTCERSEKRPFNIDDMQTQIMRVVRDKRIDLYRERFCN